MRTDKIFYVMSIILTFNLFSFDASSSTLNDFFPDLENSLFKVQIQEFTDDGKVADSRDSLMVFKRDGNIIRTLDQGSMTEILSSGLCIDLTKHHCNRKIESLGELYRQRGKGHWDQVFLESAAEMGGLVKYDCISNRSDVKDSRITIKVVCNYDRTDEVKNFAYTIDLLSKEQLPKLHFTSMDDIEITPCRQKLSDIIAPIDALYNSIFKITHTLTVDDGLNIGDDGHGTGFYISNQGHFLTNQHVIDSNPKCLQKGVCKIILDYTDINGKVFKEEKRVQLLTCHTRFDFCLIKIENFNSSNPFLKLQLNEKNTPASSKIYTVGFPGDKSDKTISHGEVVGTSGNSLLITNAIFGGASGSPVLSKDTNQVIGIISHGSTYRLSDGSFTGYARPIKSIENEFRLSEYLSGEMEEKVNKIILNIKDSQDPENVGKELRKYLKLKTFLGIPALKEFMLTHPSQEIRMLIMTKLEEMGVIKF